MARLSASERSGSILGQKAGERQNCYVKILPLKSNIVSSVNEETIFEGNNSEDGWE